MVQQFMVGFTHDLKHQLSTFNNTEKHRDFVKFLLDMHPSTTMSSEWYKLANTDELEKAIQKTHNLKDSCYNLTLHGEGFA